MISNYLIVFITIYLIAPIFWYYIDIDETGTHPLDVHDNAGYCFFAALFVCLTNDFGFIAFLIHLCGGTILTLLAYKIYLRIK